jgi:hypothetical protein
VPCTAYAEGECNAQRGCVWYGSSRCNSNERCVKEWLYEDLYCNYVGPTAASSAFCSGNVLIDLGHVCRNERRTELSCE